jgi:hypothetical protein
MGLVMSQVTLDAGSADAGSALSGLAGEHPNNTVSQERRIRAAFMRFGLSISIVIFLVVSIEVLSDQWAIGKASAVFMLGTELLIAGASVALFAIIAAAGLAISIAFKNCSRAPLQTRN